MKLLNYLMGAVMAMVMIGCEHPEQESTSKYPPLESIVDTRWYSVDTKNQIYYDIDYATTTGTMVGYNNSLREEEISRREFQYTFTPATERVDALVNVTFDDGATYGGMVVPKGQFQVNDKDVYWIQLYEVDEKGYIIYDEHGKIKSSILMWRE